MEINKVLILGGTGSLGRSLIDHMRGTKEITVLSRDEHKQQALKKIYPDIKFILGDIRDKDSMRMAFKNQDAVFHVAALKHVDILELNSVEALKTNTIASINVADLCIDNNIKTCMYSSTDKAVYPINAYGYSKAFSEKIFHQYNTYGSTNFNVYRWPNVIGSSGSALPFFIEKLKAHETVPITNYDMTRFWIKLENAVRFVLNTYNHTFRYSGTIIYPELKAATLIEVVDVLAELLGVKYTTTETGMRPGEKLHEAMIAHHEGEYLDSLNAPGFTRAELKELLAGLCQS